jgi:hypothetical protein
MDIHEQFKGMKNRTNQDTSYFENDFAHFIHQWFYSPLLCPGLFFSFVIFYIQTVGPLGRVISTSQDRCLHTGQHKHKINAYIDIHALSWIQTHDPNVRASEGSSCLRPRGHCDLFLYGGVNV